jgi:cyclopropane-fatty-acyl-phospholipid synthase
MTIADLVTGVLGPDLPIGLRAYDGSSAGPVDPPATIVVKSPDAVRRLVTAPGDLGFGRAYVAGDLDIEGDLFAALELRRRFANGLHLSRQQYVDALKIVGKAGLRPMPPPPEEVKLKGRRHSKTRDAAAIAHHYDVSNDFYRIVLGPSLTYSCGVWASPHVGLESAQAAKYELIGKKLDLKPGMRLLDVGCGWGGMVRFAAREYGVKALGATLSAEQASWAKEAIDREGLANLAEVRHSDYRDVLETGFDAVSSIGLTEHIGVCQYPAYFGFLKDKLRPQGRLLNHCITRPHNHRQETGAFIDRYVFPDGELTGVGRIVTEVQDIGLEVMHAENFRLHYMRTCAAWCQNLVDNWDECVAEVGEGTARVWGLYMAGSRMGFELNEIQLDHVLAVKTEGGVDGFPLRSNTWV